MNAECAHNSEPEDSEFYFESDHLALKGNKDYTALLKTIIMLEAQRTQGIADLDKLLEAQKIAMQDPVSFVAKLQDEDFVGFPGPQKIADIPYIDWTKYNIVLPDSPMRPQTRHGPVLPQLQVKSDADEGKILVRGRAFDQSKPETFNQLWTTEEQRRLEELLIEYPPEEVEMRRWTKIANALGNRTPKQVSSRVQKYFIKLLRAGLPIPGRGPKVRMDVKRGTNHRHQRNNYLLLKPSTFFPHQDMPFNFGEDARHLSIIEDSEDDCGNGTLGDTAEMRHIQLLRLVKAEKGNEQLRAYSHIGYRCLVCKEEPLKGTRWHCKDCEGEMNFCGDCAVAQWETDTPIHPPSHRLIAVRPTQSNRTYDSDYFSQSFNNSSYNYLDPNFLPE
ncbi:ZZ-type zinc finger-containing protein 3 [Athalia rosae]|uniref:ZZ-type zinc finger-containing protein 3 n=1 Tax=Athalia rosae TaxID=37344 RepID=UPI002033E07F|nr:ZZ-type zinc finger-containing protein 3 [Athalia rosae]